jgi:hypothetical protein
VVLPAPRKPERTVTGRRGVLMLEGLGCGVLFLMIVHSH